MILNKAAHTTNDFRSIALDDIPLIDVRAPIEFKKGAFPNSTNLPLMNDRERELVGVCYKTHGTSQAVTLGHKLVSGDIRSDRIDAWLRHIKQFPESIIYCFRGGQRSAITQQWLQEVGVEVSRIAGGYKAFRSYLIDVLESITDNKRMIVLAGHTGSGKTILLNKLDRSIDLEAIANHRGSSFGRHPHPQPTQINFENSLAYRLIKHDHANYSQIIVEDESKNIGRCYIPDKLFGQMCRSKIVVLERSLQERVEITYSEYIIASQAEYEAASKNGSTPYSWIDVMRHNLKRIKKRLGHKSYTELLELLESAWVYQQRHSNPSRHKIWIERLLKEYYDPMYEYQLKQKSDRVIFRGGEQDIIDYLS